MRDTEQIQRTRLAHPHQFGEELCRVIDVLDHLGGHHPCRRTIGNRQRRAIGDVALDARGNSVRQPQAGRLDLGRIDVGDDDLRPTGGTEMHVAAVTAADIQQGIVGGHRETGEQLTGLLIEPATQDCVAQAQHVGVSLGCGRFWRYGHGGGSTRSEFLQQAQHVVTPGAVTAVREAFRRAIRHAPRSRMGSSMNR
ncbi:hypothetical protein D3C84_272070 [compost metagenome]